MTHRFPRSRPSAGGLLVGALCLSACGVPAKHQRHLEQRIQVPAREVRAGVGVCATCDTSLRVPMAQVAFTEHVAVGGTGFLAVGGGDAATSWSVGMAPGFTAEPTEVRKTDDPRVLESRKWKRRLIWQVGAAGKTHFSADTGLEGWIRVSRNSFTASDTVEFGDTTHVGAAYLIAGPKRLDFALSAAQVRRTRLAIGEVDTSYVFLGGVPDGAAFAWAAEPWLKVGVSPNVVLEEGNTWSLQPTVSLWFRLGGRYAGEEK